MSVIAEGGLTVEHVAALFGVSERTIARWQNDARDPLPILKQGSGRIRTEYDPRAVFLWGLQRFGNADVIDLDRERALNLRADTRLKEIKEQQFRNELAPIALLTHALTSLAAQVSATLDTILPALKRVRPDLTATDFDAIRRELVKAQNACADIRIDATDADSDSGESGINGVSETATATTE
jgi:phage terminase Nu1 subunit (DNA packaging protein)